MVGGADAEAGPTHYRKRCWVLTDLFVGPISRPEVSCAALNAEIPWAGGCLLRTKPLSRQKGANPHRI